MQKIHYSNSRNNKVFCFVLS